jgi:hypothetical protein
LRRSLVGFGDLLGNFRRQEQNLDGLAFGHIENVVVLEHGSLPDIGHIRLQHLHIGQRRMTD